MRLILTFLVLLSINLSCEPPSPSWQPIIADALHQAIALEKLPDSFQVLSGSDTIWIYPVKYNENSKVFDEDISDELPYQIDKWIVRSIDSKIMKEKSTQNEFSYLSISAKQVSGECIIDIIQETSFPPTFKGFLIDRGRITITYEYNNNLWIIKDIVRWYG